VEQSDEFQETLQISSRIPAFLGVIDALLHALVVPVAKQDFRTTVFHCAAERSKRTFVVEERCRTEINQFNAEPFVNDHIFVFDIAMHDAKSIEVGQCRHKLHAEAYKRVIRSLSHSSYWYVNEILLLSK